MLIQWLSQKIIRNSRELSKAFQATPTNCSPTGGENLISQPKRPVAVIWDLDGTLVDSAPDLAGALNTLLQEHQRLPLEVANIRRMIGNGVPKLIERGFGAGGRELQADELQELVPRFMAIYSQRATQLTRPYSGVQATLQSFQDAGASQAVCTNKPEAISRKILQALDLYKYFKVVVGGDTLEHRKPHPLPLQTCLNELGSSIDGAVMIGDSAVDVATARAVGMNIAIVDHGYSRQPVDTLGADFLITDLAALPDMVAI